MTSTIRVLLVEDIEITRMGLRTVLNRTDRIDVTGEAIDGEMAVRLAGELNPDVILMDLGLPRISGIDATRQIKELYPQIKVIVLTTSEEEEQVLAALGAGANAYCVKSMPSAELVDVIYSVAGGAAWLAPSIAAVALKIFSEQSALPKQIGHIPSPKEYNLTERELEVLQLLVEGKSNTTIGKQLWISSNTAKAHVANIMNKLLVNDRVQAAVKAIKEGLVK